MSKRILSLVLVLALVLGSFSMAFADTAVTTSAKSMTDVEGTQYQKAVETLGKLNVLEGYADGTFKPGNTITRAEFAAVASRIRGLETAAQNSKGKTEFKDVPASHWASGYVNVASKNGLIKGMGNGEFAPEAQITYEQAITMIVRALGYEYAAQSLGGYPVGYLSVASQEQLLRGINEGAQGTPATRGLVALLLNNALDIPKMIQVGYGDQARWVKSGTVDGAKATYLFEDLGLIQLDKAQVTKVDSKKQQVTLERKAEFRDERDIKIGLKADKDFNYSGFEGLRVTAWYNDRTDELIVCKDDGVYKAKYDVIEKTSKSNEIKLIKADEKLDVDSKAKVTLDQKDANMSDFTENSNTYAKVIVNEYGDVNWIEAYSLNDKIVVNKVEKNLIKGYDRREISDANDYTIIKDGKQISVNDLEEKDFLIYDSKSEVAVVITDIRTGKIDTVYKSGFKFEGKTYDNDVKDLGFVQYIVEDNLEDVTQEVLEEMQKNGEVKIYFSFNNKPLFIDGKAEEVASNYVMLESDTKKFDNRGTENRTFDVLNSEGKVVKYEVKISDIQKTGTNKLYATNSLTTWDSTFKAGVVVKITTDADNKLTKVENVTKATGITNVEIDDTYLAGSRLQSNTVVFMANGETKVKDYSVIKWADAKNEFKKVLTGDAYTFDGKVVAIFADTTDGDESTEAVVGVLKKVQETIKGSKYDLIVAINGSEKSYTAKNFSAVAGSNGSLAASALIGMEDKVVILDVAKGGNEVKKWNTPSSTDIKIGKMITGKVTSATSGRIKLENDTMDYIVEGQYYNNSLKSTIKAGDVLGKNVTLYMQPGSDKYVQIVQEGTGSGSGAGLPVNTDGVVTYINGNKLQIDNGLELTVQGAATTVLSELETNFFPTNLPNAGTKVELQLVKTGDVVTGIKNVVVSTNVAADFEKAIDTKSVVKVVNTEATALTLANNVTRTNKGLVDIDFGKEVNGAKTITIVDNTATGTMTFSGTKFTGNIEVTAAKATGANNVGEVVGTITVNSISLNTWNQNGKADKIVWKVVADVNGKAAKLNLVGKVKEVDVATGEANITGVANITTKLTVTGKANLDVAPVAGVTFTDQDKVTIAGTATSEAKLADAKIAAKVQEGKVVAAQSAYVAIEGSTSTSSAIYVAVTTASTTLGNATAIDAYTDVALLEARTNALKSALNTLTTQTAKTTSEVNAVKIATIENTEEALSNALSKFAGYDATKKAAYFTAISGFSSLNTREAIVAKIAELNI